MDGQSWLDMVRPIQNAPATRPAQIPLSPAEAPSTAHQVSVTAEVGGVADSGQGPGMDRFTRNVWVRAGRFL